MTSYDRCAGAGSRSVSDSGRNVVSRWAFLVVGALFLLGSPALAQETGTVNGTVRPVDGTAAVQSGAGLAGVQVEAQRADGSRAASVLTGQQGRYRLVLEPGTYTLVFSLPGWETVEAPGVAVTAGEATFVDMALTARAFDLNPITVSASRRVEKALEAPAAVEVRSTQDIVEKPAITVADHIGNVAAVDVIRTGVQGNYVTVRGFNNIFSGSTLTLTDNRIGRVPSLRANVLHMNPTTNLDIERVEVVLGPGSALYGPNAANGVIHSITKSPIDYPGGTLSIGAGLRQQGSGSLEYSVDTDLDDVPETFTDSYESSTEPIYHVEGRYAVRAGDQFGIKVSGQYFMGEEYRFLDREELQQQRLAQA
ncbi:MAG TPA: TonB-dependent receptor plug domain-containing protein, partial [Longimicrobiales bacterium]|nr:TonB-dependent receptor plug domain-containing protein [Longimicrobiales bacterium]